MPKAYKFDLEVKGQHRISSHGSCAKYGKPMSNQKNSSGPDMKTCQTPYKFDLEVRVKEEMGIWIFPTHYHMVIHSCAKYGKPMSNQKKSYGLDMKTCQKPYKFDFEVKVLGCIWIMNVGNTSFNGDTPMCQIW